MRAYFCTMNKELPLLIETRSATLERTSHTLIELRFKPEVKLDVKGLMEIVKAKRGMIANGNADVLAILPPDFDFELNVLSMAPAALEGGSCNAKRLAFAAQSTFNERLASIYFKDQPREHPTGVFLNEEDARTWLSTGIPMPSAS